LKLNVGTGYFVKGKRTPRRRNRDEEERARGVRNPAPPAPGWIRSLAPRPGAPEEAGSIDGLAEPAVRREGGQ
jgi:hypothetical protein